MQKSIPMRVKSNYKLDIGSIKLLAINFIGDLG